MAPKDARAICRWFTLAGVVAAVAVLVPVASTETGSASAQYPGLYFVYNMDCTFTVENDAGTPVTSIPPGTYNTVVRTPVAFGAYPYQTLPAGDMTACHGLAEFQLTGPGVSLSTTVYGGCLTDEEYIETFQPHASYVAQDNNQPSLTHTVVTTLASGSAQPVTGPSSPAGKGSSQSTDIVGSALVTLRGTLAARLTAAGKATLTVKGKPVRKLMSGRYTFKVADRDRNADFRLRAPALGVNKSLSGVAFVGTKTTTLTLEPGRWLYSSGSGKTRTFFVVAA
jgi:hypothetical protein